MSATEMKVREQQVTESDTRAVVEAAREKEWVKPSFVRELFLGNLRMDLLHPFPEPDPEEEARAEELLGRFRAFLEKEVDNAEIEREAKIPQRVIDGLRELGAFGLKIPREYGGLALSQRSYNRVVSLVASANAAVAVLLSAHQSIGVPQPLKMFGTEEQKKKYLPRFAQQGDISAFALTEPEVGSDPARMEATADLSEDGSHYILNGEKLWTTNGPIADVMVVMARTPAGPGETRRRISAFIVENSWEGVETTHRLSFMGLRGIENGTIRFTNVKVPRENLLWGEGKGLKLALMTLNTGRLTIPATSVAAGKWCLQVARRWAAEREQWGAPIGKHDAIAQKLGTMAATVFAMEAVAELSAAMADKGDHDIRLEAAIAKMYNSEWAWRIGDETLQIRGGRGYETAESLASRGEAAIPMEQVLRDLRINTIFEGSSEIMRLFIAREAVDPHVQKAEALANPDASLGEKARDAVGLGTHMAGWVSSNVVGWSRWPAHDEFGPLSAHVGYADRAARKLARTLAFVMARYGLKLEKKQAVLGRIVDVGAEIFAIAATCSYAVRESNRMGGDQGPIILAKLFCRQARRRAEAAFDAITSNDDSFTYGVAQDVLAGRYAWLEEGIVPAPRDLSVS